MTLAIDKSSKVVVVADVEITYSDMFTNRKSDDVVVKAISDPKKITNANLTLSNYTTRAQ